MTLEAVLGGGEIVGLLVMQQHQLRAGHVVAIDELGYVDPSDGFSDHVPFDQYPLIQAGRGFVFDRDFLAIPTSDRHGGRSSSRVATTSRDKSRPYETLAIERAATETIQ